MYDLIGSIANGLIVGTCSIIAALIMSRDSKQDQPDTPDETTTP